MLKTLDDCLDELTVKRLPKAYGGADAVNDMAKQSLAIGEMKLGMTPIGTYSS